MGLGGRGGSGIWVSVAWGLAPGYVDHRPLSKVCQAHGLPPCPRCSLMQRGVRHCCQRGHHKVNTPHKGLAKRTALAPAGANKRPRLQSAAPAHSRMQLRSRWPLAQHTTADWRSRLHVTHAGSLWAGHACDEITGEGAWSHAAGAVGCGALLRVTVYGAWAALPPPITG